MRLSIRERHGLRGERRDMAYLWKVGRAEGARRMERRMEGSKSLPDWVSGDAGVPPHFLNAGHSPSSRVSRDFRRRLQNIIDHARSTWSSSFIKESKILWTTAASHHPSHFRTAQEIPFRSGSSTNERVRSRSDPGDLGTVNTSRIRGILWGKTHNRPEFVESQPDWS